MCPLRFHARPNIKKKKDCFAALIITGKPFRECYYLGMKAAGFVLVGGQSRRMGRDKARLPMPSGLLVETIASTLAQVTESVALVGPPGAYSDLPYECLSDRRPGLGPLAGLETALFSQRTEFNLVAGCDMPNLESSWLCALLKAAEAGNSLCVAAQDAGGRIHPLCAVYRSASLPFVQRALDSGRLRLRDLLSDLAAETLEIGATVENVNTPAQWAAWQAANF